MRSIWVLVMVLSAACASSDAVTCDFGTCPGGYACDSAHDRCVLPEQLLDCAGMPDDASCTAGAAEGLCIDEVCLAKGCGDFRLDGAEECDGNLFVRDATDCLQVGFYTSGPIACRADCTIDTSQCGTQRCGDGVLDVDKSEICEPSLAETSTTCDAIGFYNTAAVACTSFCTYDIQSCAGYCGDNIVNGPELCDGTEPLPSYLSCLDYGYDAGATSCGGGCFADTSACHHHDLTYVGLGDEIVPEGIYLTSPTSGYLAGFDGAGHGRFASWNGVEVTDIPIPTGGRFRDISGAGPSTVFMVGESGRVGRYDGTTYTESTISATEVYNGVHLLTPTDGYLAGVGPSAAAVVRHWDGASWTSMSTGATSYLQSIYAISATDIWAVGSAGTIVHGNGASFSPVASGTGTMLRSVWGSSPTDVFAVGDSGTIRHYNGVSWSAMTSPTGNSLSSVWGTSATDVYAVGSFDYLHYDGQHWVSLETEVPFLDNVIAWDASHLIVTQSSGGVLREDGAGWTPPATFAVQDFPREMWGTSETNVYLAVGTKVMRYNGATWTQVATATGGAASVWGSGPSDVFVGQDSAIIHYNGMTWTPTTVGDQFVYGIWGTSGTNVYAITELGSLYHYDGMNWTLSKDFGDDGHALWGSAANDIWMAGGELWHYDGAWTKSPLPTVGFQDIWGTSASNVYTVSDADVWHYDGNGWSKLDVPNVNAELLTSIVGTGPDDVWVAGQRVLLHWNGTQWLRVRPYESTVIDFLWPTQGDIFMSASNGHTVYMLRRGCLTCGL